MSNKINIDNAGGFNAVRAAAQSEVKKTAGETAKLSEAQKSSDSDRLALSDRGTEVGKLVEDLKSVPDVRQEKIAALRDQIATGQYDPSNEKIADAFLKDEGI